MFGVGDAKSLVELLAAAWDWVRNRRNPIRRQAHRFLQAFEAHGIARQQIPRVLPKRFEIGASAFADADKLRDALSPQLLDWAADYLALSRAWLDGTADHPHRLVEHYKDEAQYGVWFKQRAAAEDAHRILYVLAQSDPAKIAPYGFLSLLYEEVRPGLDDGELSRYWRLSREWPIEHARCVQAMLEVLCAAREEGILVVGRVVPPRTLHDLEHGRIFAGKAIERAAATWYPEDLEKQLADVHAQ